MKTSTQPTDATDVELARLQIADIKQDLEMASLHSELNQDHINKLEAALCVAESALTNLLRKHLTVVGGGK